MNPLVRNAIVKVLSLPTKDLNLIGQTLERGTLYEQLSAYGKVISFLTSVKLYDRRYDYYTIRFRNVPHHYWLSKLALKLLSNAKYTT